MIISISGDGGAGKDTLALWLKENTSLTYTKSTSAYVKTEMFEYMTMLGFVYPNEEVCYADRINHRTIWAKFIDDYNCNDPARLYKKCLEDQQILTGVRRYKEFKACLDLNIINLKIWVLRPGNPKDSTQEYGPELCDVILLNDTISSFLGRAKNLFRELGVLNER